MDGVDRDRRDSGIPFLSTGEMLNSGQALRLPAVPWRIGVEEAAGAPTLRNTIVDAIRENGADSGGPGRRYSAFGHWGGW